MNLSVSDFLSSWLGPPDTAPAALPRDSDWLPEPLKDWYRLTSQWTAPIMRMKRFRRPAEIVPEAGRSVFMTDPTGDYFWAFDLGDPDIVYESEDGNNWMQSAESLPECLLHNALSEAAYSAVAWRECDQLEEDLLPAVLAPMDEVAVGGWRWPRPGGRIFLGQGLVAETGPAMDDYAPWGNKPGHVEIRVGTNIPSRLRYLDDIPGIKWIGGTPQY